MRMYHKNTDIQICYIGGGSRGWAWDFMSDLALQEDISGTVYLYDIDKAAAETNARIGNRVSQSKDAKSIWKYEAIHDIGTALSGVDFVVISILPGGFKEMASDVHTPEKYGIYQPVGDSTGPGGLFRALRTIPIYIDIANAIKKYAPNAWVINYTNPMALCVATLYKVFPDIKAFGCCHEVFSTQKLFAVAAEELLGLHGLKREDININVLGINHFTWIDTATVNGIDLFPVYERFIEKHAINGIEINEKNLNTNFVCMNLVKFDLYKRFGIAAAAGDRHLVEFVPWYLEEIHNCEKWGFELTPVDWRIKNRNELLEKSLLYASGELDIPLMLSGEEGVQQIIALLGLGDIVTNVNMPNAGQMLGLGENVVVETNAQFVKDEVRPLEAGELPAAINLLTKRHVDVQQAVLHAVFENDKDLAFWAFTQDPLNAKLTLDDAVALFDEMYENTKEYLPFR